MQLVQQYISGGEQKMQDNTMKTKTKLTKNQMNKYSTVIQATLLQAVRVPNSALVLSHSWQNREYLHVRISWKLSDTIWVSLCLWLPSYVVSTPIEKSHHFSHSPLFESRICTPADHAHCWHTSSSGRNAPLDLFARGTQLQSHLQDWERDQIKRSVTKT